MRRAVLKAIGEESNNTDASGGLERPSTTKTKETLALRTWLLIGNCDHLSPPLFPSFVSTLDHLVKQPTSHILPADSVPHHRLRLRSILLPTLNFPLPRLSPFVKKLGLTVKKSWITRCSAGFAVSAWRRASISFLSLCGTASSQ